MKSLSKILMTVFLSFLLITIVGCSDNNSTDNQSIEETNDDETNKEEQKKTTESKYPFPANTEVIGDGKIVLSTPAGTSENNNVPVLFASDDDSLTQIGIDAENFDGSKQSFVYIDQEFSHTDQFGERTQTSLDLQDEWLDKGAHTVSVVQFENDDPTNGSVTSFAESKYEVQERKQDK